MVEAKRYLPAGKGTQIDVDGLPVLPVAVAENDLFEEQRIVRVNVEFPRPFRRGRDLEIKRRLRAESGCAAEDHPACLVAWIGGQSVSVEIGDAANAGHAATGASVPSSFECPVRIPPRHEIVEDEALGCWQVVPCPKNLFFFFIYDM